VLGLLDSYFDPGLVEVGLLLGTSLVEVGPDPLLVVLGALLGPDLLDPVLLEVGLLVVVHEDGVGDPGPVEVGLLLGTGLVEVGPDPVLVALGPNLLDPVLDQDQDQDLDQDQDKDLDQDSW
jgi:hypothetical protein